jgi:hypothetical protein
MLERHKKSLVKLFQQVQELRANPVEKRMLALEIQEQLLYRIGCSERVIRQIRGYNKSIKRTLAQPGASKEAARKAKAKSRAGNSRIEQQKTLISVLRSIGDSIAFIYGDRWDLKQLVQKEESGFLTGKKGTRLERRILRKAFEVGATVVMNDLTHTLRHGDITLFRPDLWPDGGSPFLLIEAKSGRGGDRERAARQISAIGHISEYLSTDKREVNGGLWQRVSVNEEPQYHFEDATRMMSKLPHAGWLVEEVEPGLHYVLIDCAYELGEYEPIFGKFAPSSCPFMISVNDMKDHQLAYCPFPLCIHDAEALFRFYNGDFVMFVVIDLEQVNKTLVSHSIKVTLSGKDEYPWQVSSTTHDSENQIGVSCLGFHPVGRLAAEFLSLKWLLENMIVGQVNKVLAQYLKSGT